jgi:hypothetical protein
MKAKKKSVTEDLRPEYTFNYPDAVRGKYHQRLSKEGANVVILEPDVAQAFPDSAEVNDALRALLQIARSSRRPAARSSRTTREGVAA